MLMLYSDRKWVRGHAQDYILEYFRTLAERRKTAHSNHLDNITAQAYYHYQAPPHPKQISDANASLKRGIDEDWQASVDRYPEVLEYFFSLVELTLPADDEECITDPPLNAPANNNNTRKANRRSGPPEGHGPPQITMGGHGAPPPHAPAQIGPPPSAYGGGRGMRGGDRGGREARESRDAREEREEREEYARAYMPLSRESRRTPGPTQQAHAPPPTRRPSRRSMGPQHPPAHAPYIEHAPY